MILVRQAGLMLVITVKANGSLGGASQLRELSEVVRFSVRAFTYILSIQNLSKLQLHKAQAEPANR